MKTFYVRFDEENQTMLVTVMVPAAEGWVKKTLVAGNPDQLWDGIEKLEAISKMPEVQRDEALSIVGKAQERSLIESALQSFLMKGNKIKILPAVGTKVQLNEEEQDEILGLLAEIDLGIEAAA